MINKVEDKNELKKNWRAIISDTIFIALCWTFGILLSIIGLWNNRLWGLAIIGLLILIGTCLVTFNSGLFKKFYITSEYIGIEKFEHWIYVKEYFIFFLFKDIEKGHILARMYTHPKEFVDKVASLNKIKLVKTYNRQKKLTSLDFVPSDQIYGKNKFRYMVKINDKTTLDKRQDKK